MIELGLQKPAQNCRKGRSGRKAHFSQIASAYVRRHAAPGGDVAGESAPDFGPVVHGHDIEHAFERQLCQKGADLAWPWLARGKELLQWALQGAHVFAALHDSVLGSGRKSQAPEAGQGVVVAHGTCEYEEVDKPGAYLHVEIEQSEPAEYPGHFGQIPGPCRIEGKLRVQALQNAELLQAIDGRQGPLLAADMLEFVEDARRGELVQKAHGKGVAHKLFRGRPEAEVVALLEAHGPQDTGRILHEAQGVEHAYLVYRRTKRYMPADEEELVMAVEDGVEFMELLAPVKLENGRLLCKVMKLGDYDASGRRGVVETGEEKEIPADTVIAAVGERVPTAFYESCGIRVNDRGRAVVNEETCESSRAGVYIVGDGMGGPATVVEGISNALKAARAVIGEEIVRDFEPETDEDAIYGRKGSLNSRREDGEESGRCLGCSGICENCVEACPNRANIAIRVPGMEKHQIIHVDYMCNECGNCRSFCPYDSAPYLDKFTLFADENDMDDSRNQGFAVLDKDQVKCKVRFFGETSVWTKGDETRIPEALQKLMETVCKDYSYMLRDQTRNR